MKELLSQIAALRPPPSERGFFAQYLSNATAQVDLLTMLEGELSKNPREAVARGPRGALVTGYGRQLANVGRRQERLIASEPEMKPCSTWTP